MGKVLSSPKRDDIYILLKYILLGDVCDLFNSHLTFLYACIIDISFVSFCYVIFKMKLEESVYKFFFSTPS